MDRDSQAPVENLVGTTLENGWIVKEKLEPNTGTTGGTFSTGYIVQDENGNEYFLKAIDLSRALGDDVEDPVKKVYALTQAYLYEQNLFEECKGLKYSQVSRIVRYLSAGYLVPKNEVPEKYLLVKRVPFLLFQMATGGLRTEIEQLKLLSRNIDLAWSMRAMHQISLGLSQLHQIKIAHRDIKPSNVVSFGDEGYKISDLGSAKKINTVAPRDHYAGPGDYTYLPLEYYYSLYKSSSTKGDWYYREISTDYYMLGGLAYYLVTNVPLTASIMAKVHANNKFPDYRGFYHDVLEYLIDAWDKTLSEFKDSLHSDHFDLVNRLLTTIAELTHPDPSKRGHPKATTIQSQFMTGRYVTKFDVLAGRAEHNLFRVS